MGYTDSNFVSKNSCIMYKVANAYKKEQKTLENIHVFTGCYLVISGHITLNQLKSNTVLRPNRKQYEANNQVY